jgi:hypothetical protein
MAWTCRSVRDDDDDGNDGQLLYEVPQGVKKLHFDHLQTLTR